MTLDLGLQTTLQDRVAAGRLLVEPLMKYAGRPDVIILALPRGGVPVAYEVATALKVRLDLMLVRKLGIPSRPEFAMGAIASGGVHILNEEAFTLYRIDQAVLDSVLARERRELSRREQLYRKGRPPLYLKDQVVILIDDGLATGSTMRAAIHAARTHSPSRMVVAAPVASLDTVKALRAEVNEVICPLTPEWLVSIGFWYLDFSQTSDDQVIDLLHRAWRREASGQALPQEHPDA